jgi:hypothetical protein
LNSHVLAAKRGDQQHNNGSGRDGLERGHFGLEDEVDDALGVAARGSNGGGMASFVLDHPSDIPLRPEACASASPFPLAAILRELVVIED